MDQQRDKPRRPRGVWPPGLTAGLTMLLALNLGAGCASGPRASERKLAYPADVLAFTNQTHWVYGIDPATGRQTHIKRVPKPDYALHCFAMARATREFLWQARFDPATPRVSEAEYRERVLRVVRRNSRTPSPERERIVIPGYASLAEFSRDHEQLLKNVCGGAAQSYWQRGNWRMVFPFSRRGQAREAQRLLADVQAGRPAIVHAVCFPSLTLNHVVVLFEAADEPHAIRFQAYDPNTQSSPLEVKFDKTTRQFLLPPTHYFIGGPVNLYEVFRGPCY